MAFNPLLSCRSRKKSYSLLKARKSSFSGTFASNDCNHVTTLRITTKQEDDFIALSDKRCYEVSDFASFKTSPEAEGSMENQPPPKRRRTVESLDDSWNDEDLDLVLSQMPTDPHEPHEPRGPPQGTLEIKDENQNKPTISQKKTKGSWNFQSSFPSDPGPVRQVSRPMAPKFPSAPVQGNRSLNRSSSSDESTTSFRLDHSSSFSSENKSTSSIKSASSIEIPLGPSSLSRHSSGLNMSLSISGQAEHINRAAKLEKTVEELKEELMVREGEITNLRKNLQEKDKEISNVREDKNKAIEQCKKGFREELQALEASLQKTSSELQFREQDLAAQQEKLKSMEAALKAFNMDSQSSASSQSSPVKMPHASYPSPRVIRVGGKSPGSGAEAGSAFPTTKSFMARDRSPREQKGQKETVLPSTSGHQSKAHVGPGVPSEISSNISQKPAGLKRKKHQHPYIAMSSAARGEVSGPDIVAHLLNSTVSQPSRGQQGNKGVISLLENPEGHLNIQSLQFDRTSTNQLAPIPNKNLTDLKLTLSTTDASESHVNRNMFEGQILAIRGLRNILRLPPPSLDSSHDAGDCGIDSIVLLLPLLYEYMSQYIDMILSPAENASKGLSPQSSLKSSSSLDSSLESLASSLNVLLKDCANFANHMERKAVIALNVLRHLVVQCSSVRNTLLEHCQEKSSTLAVALTDDPSTNNKELRDSQSSSSQSQSSQDPDSDPTFINSTKKVQEMKLINKLVKLANPGQGSYKYNVHVVELALDILIALSESVTATQLERLLEVCEVHVLLEILLNCFECEADHTVVLRAVHLMTSLCASKVFFSHLCSCPDGCALNFMYHSCCTILSDLRTPEKVTRLIVTAASTFLSNILSYHKEGYMMLVEGNCRCKGQVVKMMIVMYHRILVMYEQKEDALLFELLRRGLFHIFMVYELDKQFEDKRSVVEHQFVRLVSGLHNIFNNTSEQYPQECSAVVCLLESDDASEFDDDSQMEIND